MILFNFFDEIRLQVALSIFYSIMFSLKMIIDVCNYRQTKKEILEDIDFYKGLLEEKAQNERLDR